MGEITPGKIVRNEEAYQIVHTLFVHERNEKRIKGLAVCAGSIVFFENQAPYEASGSAAGNDEPMPWL